VADDYRYTLLICSLPHHARLFTEKRTPISRLRLEQHLNLLAQAHAALLWEIERLAQWDYLSHEETDAEIARYAAEFVPRLEDPALREILGGRLILRTLVAGLRRRLLGDAPPGPREPWGFGRWIGTMARHWSDPAFGLARPFPWLPEADRLLREGDSLGLERLLLTQSWIRLDRAGAGHYFDFPAVVVYVLKWNIVDRWSRFDADGAIARFGQLAADGLEQYRELFVAA